MAKKPPPQQATLRNLPPLATDKFMELLVGPGAGTKFDSEDEKREAYESYKQFFIDSRKPLSFVPHSIKLYDPELDWTEAYEDQLPDRNWRTE